MPNNNPGPEGFWAKVKRTDTCWLWTGATRKGYGFLRRLGKREMRAHRYAWYLTHGALPSDGLLVCHKCDVRNCVNPEHLFLGTAQDNIDDMIKKGRFKINPQRGEKCGRSKLTESDVIKIRRLNAETTLAKSTIGILFMVSADTIRQVVLRETWRHVP